MAKELIKIKEVNDGVDGAPPWITTFVDMVSLLVTFFILLYTFASIKEFETFTSPRNIIGSSGVFKGKASDTMVAPKDDLMLAMDLERGSRKRHTRPVNELSENMEEMGQKLTEEHVPIDMRAVADGMRLRFAEKAGFRPGGVSVNRSLHKALVELAETTSFYPIMIVVEGHTDDAFMPSPSYPDAQSLSIARARAAAEVLVRDGGTDPALIMLEGYGDDRPFKDAVTASERAANRRVEVRLVSMSKDRVASNVGGNR
ncbi:MAG: chemotaxis protein MotB [Planctomycetota bacterium]|jgi:chemotaxis protein MotB